MRILVTGADGQLGRSLRKIAPEYVPDTFVFTDLPEGDITDRGAIEAIVVRERPDAIVNCAAYTAVDRAESEPEIARRVNAEGPAVLADVAAAFDLVLVHVSTDYVFDGRVCRPLREDDPVGPANVYGTVKLEGEQAVRRAGCRAAIVRTAWLYSEFGGNFVATMLRLAAGGGPVRVVYDQVGTPTWATDLARALMVLLRRGIVGCETYHYSDAGAVSWYDFAQAVFDLAGMRVAVEAVTTDRFPTAAGRPAYSVLDKTKIAAAGAEVPYWRDSLAACLARMDRLEKH